MRPGGVPCSPLSLRERGEKDGLRLILTTLPGFVIFSANDREYVQFSLEPAGLMLFWPAEGPAVSARDPRLTDLLRELSFHEVELRSKSDTPSTVNYRAYVKLSDGLYGQFGDDIDLTERFTTTAFERVFGHLTATLGSQIEV